MATVWSPGVSEQRKVSNGKMANVEIEWTAFRETPACGSLGRQARLRGARGARAGPRAREGRPGTSCVRTVPISLPLELLQNKRFIFYLKQKLQNPPSQSKTPPLRPGVRKSASCPRSTSARLPLLGVGSKAQGGPRCPSSKTGRRGATRTPRARATCCKAGRASPVPRASTQPGPGLHLQGPRP